MEETVQNPSEDLKAVEFIESNSSFSKYLRDKSDTLKILDCLISRLYRCHTIMKLLEKSLENSRGIEDLCKDDTLIILGFIFIYPIAFRNTIEILERRLARAREVEDQWGKIFVIDGMGGIDSSFHEFRYAVEIFEKKLASIRYHPAISLEIEGRWRLKDALNGKYVLDDAHELHLYEHLLSDLRDGYLNLAKTEEDLLYNIYLNIDNIVESIWENLSIGSILYNPSSEMQIGEMERVEARIAKNIYENFDRNLKGKGMPQIDRLKVSSKMIIHLDGDEAFNIQELFAKTDMAIVGDYTQWEWNVTPLKSGIQTLRLCVDAVIEMPFLPDKTKHISTLERKIRVKFNPKYQTTCFIKHYWQWIIATIIALIVATITILTYLNLKISNH
jgi:hypothetical protein